MRHLWKTKNTQKNNYHIMTTNFTLFPTSEEEKLAVKQYAAFYVAVVEGKI
jgi:hypothetical protein